MKRRMQLLLGIGATVGGTLLVAWTAVLVLVIQPSVASQEQARILQVREAAALLQAGVTKREIEVSRSIDVRLVEGPPSGPPVGNGWLPLETDRGTLWKREGGNHDLAAWTGQSWVVLQAHPPHAVTLALALGGVGLPLVLLAFGVGRRAGRPLEESERRLARIADGDLSVRLDTEAGTHEVRAVASAVNQMAARLQELMEADRQRMAGLSHELRTPLTRIRLELELARREGASVSRLDRVEQDVERFDAMLREMLELSQLEMVGETLVRRELVDLAGLVQCVLDEVDTGDVELRGAGTATVDPRLVSRLVRNLLANAAEHAPGSRRWVEVADGQLVVGDDGLGIPTCEHDQVWAPFRRGDGSVGHGLGLAIVARVAELHGGSVSLSKPPGLVVTVRFDHPATGSR